MFGATTDFSIRRFTAQDGAACHRMRCDAFRKVFRDVLPADAVERGAGAYDAVEFGARIGAMDTFVAEMDGAPAGFCTVRLLDEATAEILYLYLDLEHLGIGLGSKLARHAETAVLDKHPALSRFVLDTAVPSYNRAFWEKQGYGKLEDSVCSYPGGEVPAIRMGKTVGGS
jgi:GNAT superfamily N-acetyltransferase